MLVSTYLFCIILSSPIESLQRLSRSDRADLRINAAQQLAEMPPTQALELLKGLLADSDAEVRYHAMRSLARFSIEDAALVAQERLPAEKDPYLTSELKRTIESIQKNVELIKTRSEKAKR